MEDPLNKCADITRNIPFSLCIYNNIVCHHHHHRHNFRNKVQICISVQVCGILDPPFQVKVNPSAIFQVENYFLLNYQQNRKPLTRLATRPISDPISWSSGAVTGNIIDLSQTRPLLVAVYHKISICLRVFDPCNFSGYWHLLQGIRKSCWYQTSSSCLVSVYLYLFDRGNFSNNQHLLQGIKMSCW